MRPNEVKWKPMSPNEAKWKRMFPALPCSLPLTYSSRSTRSASGVHDYRGINQHPNSNNFSVTELSFENSVPQEKYNSWTEDAGKNKGNTCWSLNHFNPNRRRTSHSLVGEGKVKTIILHHRWLHLLSIRIANEWKLPGSVSGHFL